MWKKVKKGVVHMNPESVELMKKAQDLIQRAEKKRSQIPTKRCSNPKKVAAQMEKKGKKILSSLNIT